MKNIKFVASFTVAGFILSLLFGLFSGAGFLHIFINALIFALVFGVLSFGISIVYDKFLAIDGEGTGDVNSEDKIADSENPDLSTVKTTPVLGQNIDFVVHDEELEQSGNSNHFDVGENHQMLNETDYNHQQSQNESNAGKNEFVPIRNLETVTNFSGNESITPSESANRTKVAESIMSENDSLDVLPDMTEFAVAKPKGDDDSETIVVSDSEEASFVHSATDLKTSDNGTGEVKDAALLAKAISSILAEET